MLDVLIILVGVFDLASVGLAIARFWRLTLTLLISASVIAAICLVWESPAIRWVGGFHLFVIFLITGLLWESYRGRLKDK
jgi:hypothetical protein